MAIIRKHIQVIEDEASVRVYLRALLEREGFRVSEVDNPISVTMRDPENAPDLVLLDLNMPGLDGFKVCEELKKDESFTAPIVVVSGRTDTESKEAALKAGASAYVTKPFESDILLRVINDLLS
jgi:DNA-binding response OmpR family regulator